MNCRIRTSSRALAFFAAIGLIATPVVRAVAAPLTITPQERNWEVQVGQQVYTTYAQRGEIVPPQSQLYSILDPVADAIASIANRQYYAPFQFVLLSELQPNAFSIPGGNVYVTTAMLSYLTNRDELAGVLCHEVNHDIHHDMYNVYEEVRRGAQPIAYERAAETNADRAGAYICAEAGFNPWGMVWNMRLHRGIGQSPQMAATADHPSDDQRLADLVSLLTRDAATFGRFRDDVAASVPLPNATQYREQNSPQFAPQSGPYPPPPLPACYPNC